MTEQGINKQVDDLNWLCQCLTAAVCKGKVRHSEQRDCLLFIDNGQFWSWFSRTSCAKQYVYSIHKLLSVWFYWHITVTAVTVLLNLRFLSPTCLSLTADPPFRLHRWRGCDVHDVPRSSGLEKPWCLVRMQSQHIKPSCVFPLSTVLLFFLLLKCKCNEIRDEKKVNKLFV